MNNSSINIQQKDEPDMSQFRSHVQYDFSKRLKTLREEKRMTQSQLAEKLGVSRGSISFYENCDRVPDIEFLDRASYYFDVSVAYLIGLSENKKFNNEDIGNITNLSDTAIDFFCTHSGFGEILSEMIASGDFEYFWKYCFDYLYRRRKQQWDELTPYINDEGFLVGEWIGIDEWEDFRIYKISELFIQLLKIEKLSLLAEKQSYEGLDKNNSNVMEKLNDERIMLRRKAKKWEELTTLLSTYLADSDTKKENRSNTQE